MPRPPASRRAALYGATAPEDAPPGLAAHLLEFGEELRGEGVAVGTSELLDAFEVAARGAVDRGRGLPRGRSRRRSRSRQEDRRIFDLVFDRFFFRAAELAAVREGVGEGGGIDAAGAELTSRRCARRSPRALREGDEGRMRDLARLAIAAFGRQGEGSGVIGVDVQRIRRSLGLRAEPQPDLRRGRPAPRRPAPRRDPRASRRCLRQELERAQIERTESLPPARPLNELDRALPTGPLQDLAAVHRVVAQLKRRLKTQGQESRGRKRHAHVDVRRTMRASLETGGVPVVLKYKPVRPRRPEIYVLCDVSTSVTSASVSSSPSSTPCTTRFARCARSSSSSASARSPTSSSASATSRRSATRSGKDAGVADICGYTDYGRVWSEFARARRGRPAPARDGHRARRRAHERARPARRHLRQRRRARRADVLAQPRAAAVLELRRLA